VFVGPTFLPGESCCYECLEQRVFMNLREGANYQKYKAAMVNAQVRLGSLPMVEPVGALLAAHLVLEVLNLVLTGSTHTIGKLLAIHLPTMEMSFPDVLRLPGCAGCGAVPERDSHHLYFEPPLEPVSS
jgi:thiazole/oxazole-forming peptide maturase SagC family component